MKSRAVIVRLYCQRNNKDFSITMSKSMWHLPAIMIVCLPIFWNSEKIVVKKELPEGIYNYGTNGTGIQIIIELIFS